MFEIPCPNYVDSFNNNFHHISELDCLCIKGLLVDDTMEFKSFKNWSFTDLNLRTENNENSKKNPRIIPYEKTTEKNS